MRCRDCHHFLCCARVLKSLFVFSEFGFFLGVGRTLPLPISLQLQLSLPFVLRNRRMLHMSLGLTEPERYGQNPISGQVKGKAHPTCNWPLGACSRSAWPCAPSWLLNVFFGGVPSPDKEEWDHVIVRETEFFGSWRTCLRVSGAFLLQELEALCGRFGFGRLVPLHNVSAM